MLLTGAEILIECLKEQGVDTVFGYPGGTALCVYDALYKNRDRIKHILTSHEQGAAHAADGYARATGRTGVCLVTSGPGATNLVTGIATAYMDSVPMVAITINVSTASLGKDSFQEVDISGITMPVTKHSFIVKDVLKLADTVRRAFKIAARGRKGPILVDITKDVTQYKCEYEPQKITREEMTVEVLPDEIRYAVKLLKKSRRPVILVGGGAAASDAGKIIEDFTRQYDAAIVETLMGRTVCERGMRGFLGLAGIHGSSTANKALSEADLILALGCRFSDRITANPSGFARKADIIQIDIDPAELNKNVFVTVPIAGDVSNVLTVIKDSLKGTFRHERWVEELSLDMKAEEEAEERRETEKHKDPEELTPRRIVKLASDLFPKDCVIVTEVGQNQMWTARYYDFNRSQTLLTSGGLGTMGYGLGAAIGAKTGCPTRTVVNFAGDGCLRMNMNELATAGAYHVPIAIVLFKNNSLGMVRQWQGLFYGERYSETSIPDNIDYEQLAGAMGVDVQRPRSMSELKTIFCGVKDLKEPLLIICDISKNEYVWPMVIPGSSIERCFGPEDFYGEDIDS